MGVDSRIGKPSVEPSVETSVEAWGDGGKGVQSPPPLPYMDSKWSQIDFAAYFEHKLDPTDFASYFEHKIDPN